MINQDRPYSYNPPNPEGRRSEEYDRLIREHIADFTKFRNKQNKEIIKKTGLDHLGNPVKPTKIPDEVIKFVSLEAISENELPWTDIYGKEIKNA